MLVRPLPIIASVLASACMWACSSAEPEAAPAATECVSRCGTGELEWLQTFTLGDGGESRLSAPTDLAVTADGRAWVTVGDRLLAVRRVETGLVIEDNQSVVLPSAGRQVVAGQGALWVATAAGVLQVEPETGEVNDAPGPSDTSDWSELEWSDGLVAAAGRQVWRNGQAEDVSVSEVTDIAADGRVFVSRPDGALGWRTDSGWSVRTTGDLGFEALQYAEAVDAEGPLIVVGARGLHRYERLEGEVVSRGEVDIPAPWGVARGWDDEEPSTVHDVAFTPGHVWATTVYGGYLMRFARDGLELGAGEVVPVQPLYTDDDYEEDSLGVGLGYNPTDFTRLARLVPDGDDVWVVSSLWQYVGHSSGTVLQQGGGGITTLGGAYSVAVAPGGQHVYTGAWNAPDPGTWWLSDHVRLEPGPPVVPLGGRPVNYGVTDVAVASDGRQVFAIDDEFNRLHVYDRDSDTGQLTWRADVGDELPLSLLVGVAAAPDGREIWAADFEEGALAVYSRTPETGEVIVAGLFVDGQEGVDGLYGAEDPVPSPDGRDLYVVSYRDSAVARFKRADGASSAFVEAWRPEGPEDRMFGIEAGALTPDGARLILVSPVTDRVFVAGRQPDGTLSLIVDASIDAINPGTPPVSLLANPGRVAVNGEGDVVVSLRRWDGVALMRLQDDTLSWRTTWYPTTTPATAARWPNGVALSADGGTAIVATALGDSLLTLRLETRTSGAQDTCGGQCP